MEGKMVRQAHHDNWVVLSDVILNLFQEQKRFRVKPGMTVVAITVLFTIIFAGIACESGSGSNGDDPCNAPKGDRPTWCDAKSDTNEPQEFCGDGDCTENCNTCPQDCGCPSGFFCNEANWCEAMETCGNGVCDEGENCLNCYDCGCLKGQMCNAENVCVADTSDPLLDYYWLEGTWKCVEEDGAPGCIIVDTVDVEVTGWDIEQGAAMVLGIKPCPNGFAQKTDSDFLFFGQSETGKTKCNGNFDLTTNIVEFQSVQNHIKTWKYQKE